jgi:hypothetical protein
MRIFSSLRVTQWFVAATSVLTVLLLTFPFCLRAENMCTGARGQNGVYAYCNNGSLGIVGSSAFIDAKDFGNTNQNICGVLNGILGGTGFIPGTIIDARGLPATGTSMTCTSTPWSGITNPHPSTILLPTGTIVIPSTWTLPTGTHLAGGPFKPSFGLSGAFLRQSELALSRTTQIQRET